MRSRLRTILAHQIVDGPIGRAVRSKDGAQALRRERELRSEANRLWTSGAREDSLELLRRATLLSGGESATWHIYGARLVENGRSDAALEALKNAVQVNPGNLNALELLIEVCQLRDPSGGFVHEAYADLDALAQQNAGVHLGCVDFFIPSNYQPGLSTLAQSSNPLVRRILSLREQGDQLADVVELTGEYPPDASEVLARVHFALAYGRVSEVVELVKVMRSEDLPVDSLRRAVRRELRRGRTKQANRLLGVYLTAVPEDRWASQKYKETAPRRTAGTLTNYQLGKAGFPFPARRAQPAYESEPGRVFYLLHNSLPYNSAGYATRTHGLLSGLRSGGWDIRGVTRLGFPYDMPGQDDLGEIPAVDVIDGVPYERLTTVPVREMKNPIQQYVSRYAAAVMDKARDERPAIIHAASNHWNGLAAVTAANRLGVPSIYEVRGLWEVTRGSRDPVWAQGGMYRFIAKMEASAAAGATRVIAITHALKDELVERGVPAEKISVVPNGVNVERFRPLVRDEGLAAKLGVAGKQVIGYIGSVLDYEGIDLLIEAAGRMRKTRSDFAVLIVGDGAERERFQDAATSLGLDDVVIFTGRVPHSDVERYYSLVDIAPFPRLPLPVCEMVSPLKPFEAMAMGKAVVGSDVSAIAEIIDHGETGLLHTKGDVDSLQRALERLLDRPEERSTLALNAREWVQTNRTWQQLSGMVSDIYRSLGAVPERAEVSRLTNGQG
jgi:glycosyltransferase involved in cell wall biosynthesis